MVFVCYREVFESGIEPKKSDNGNLHLKLKLGVLFKAMNVVTVTAEQ